MARLREDVRHLKFWRSLLAEFLGSAFLVLIGCGSWTQSANQDHPDAVRIALAFGFTYAALLCCFKSLGECHISSSVTVALLVTRRTSVVRGLLYLASQLVGAIIGASFLFGVTSLEQRNATAHRIGCTVPAVDVPEGHGFGVEFFATFLFVFVVFACYEKRPVEEGGIPESVAPFLIGTTYAAVSLFAIPYSGASLNPARSFGPALIGGVWTKHWIYWFGPILGGVLGGALHDLLFSAKSSFERLKSCLLVFHRGESPTAANMGAQHEVDGDEHIHEESGLKYRARGYRPVAARAPSNGTSQSPGDKNQVAGQSAPPKPPPPRISGSPEPSSCVMAAEIQSHFQESSYPSISKQLTEHPSGDYQNVPLSACHCAVPY